MKVAIIGAGISGIGLAIKCEKYNINYTIYEMSQNVGGVWNVDNGTANKFSHVQTISQTYKFEDDSSQYSTYSRTDEINNKINENMDKFNIKEKIVFNTKLIDYKSINNNKVKVKIKNLNDNTEETKIFDALYIRTGTLNKVRELNLLNEDKFTGIIDYGNNVNKDNIDFKDKTVTLVGFGSTASENILNAFRKGAKKVNVVARSLRNIWTRKMMFQIVNEIIYPNHYLFDCSRIECWNRVNDVYNKTYDHFNKDIINKIREDTTVKIKNKIHHNASKIPTLTEDALIYCYYGLLDIYEDEIVNFEGNKVITKKNVELETDIVFKCTGYEFDDTLFKNKKLNNIIFVDGNHNITHNCGLDRGLDNDFLIGPHAEINILPLVSYPLINQTFDEIALYYLMYPNRYQILKENKLYDNIVSDISIDNVRFSSFIYLFWKIMNHLKKSPLDLRLTFRIGKHIWNLRQDLLNNLDYDKFHKIDKELWDKTSKFCHERKPEIDYLEYPFNK